MSSSQLSYLKSPNYRIHLEYDNNLDSEAVKFVNFLKSAAERRGLKLKYTRSRSACRHIILVIPREQGGNFDALLQEMILSSGLFYYAMTLQQQRNKIIHHIIEPIYKSILEERFIYTNWQHIAEHIHGALSPGEYVPTDTSNEHSQKYEVLYRKWVLKLIDSSEFIREADALATKFLLNELNHAPGVRSPQFNIALNLANKNGIGMHRDFRKMFEKIHHWRTEELHRLGNIDQNEVANIASGLFTYFQYYEEFSASQKETRELLHGEWYERVKYGDEKWLDSNGKPYDWSDENGIKMDPATWAGKRPCGDCGAIKGQYHCEGCDIEECPRCYGQFLSCDCRTDEDYAYYESQEATEQVST